MDIATIEEIVAAAMLGLDREMRAILTDDHPFLVELNHHVMAKPGKRLRPKLLVLCCKMLGIEGPLPVKYAAVFELIHTATLIHDDIIDHSLTRRGQKTLNHMLGNTLTVLYGDLLYTKAHTVAIEAGDLDVLHTITSVSERMIEGELLQNKYNYNLEITEEIYFDILRRKTAYLFGGTTKAAGLIKRCPPEQVTALFEFGFHLGTSFQLVDDYLDYDGSEDELGKPVLKDLREGKVTLPIIKLLAEEGEEIRAAIESFWKNEQAPVPLLLLEALRAHDGLRQTRDLARYHAEQAAATLESFPENEAGKLLRELPIWLLGRKT